MRGAGPVAIFVAVLSASYVRHKSLTLLLKNTYHSEIAQSG
jgi:hypothetical protein